MEMASSGGQLDLKKARGNSDKDNIQLVNKTLKIKIFILLL